MAGKHPNGMRARDERAHPVVQDAIDKGFLGNGQAYPIRGFPDHASANQARLSVARALEHFGLPRAAWVTDETGNPCYLDCQDPQAPHGVGFQLHAKNGARRHIAAQSGGDPRKLKYNPYAQRGPGHFDDNGTWITHG